MAEDYCWKYGKMQDLSEEEELGKYKVKKKTKIRIEEEFKAPGTYSCNRHERQPTSQPDLLYAYLLNSYTQHTMYGFQPEITRHVKK